MDLIKILYIRQGKIFRIGHEIILSFFKGTLYMISCSPVKEAFFTEAYLEVSNIFMY